MLGARRRAEIAFAEQPDFGGERSLAPVVAGVTRSAAKWRAHGRFVPLRHVTTRHARAGARRRSRTVTPVVAEWQPRGRAARPTAARRDKRRGVPRKTVSVDEMPSAYGSFSAMQRAAQRGVVAEFGIAEHRGHVEARWRESAAAA